MVLRGRCFELAVAPSPDSGRMGASPSSFPSLNTFCSAAAAFSLSVMSAALRVSPGRNVTSASSNPTSSTFKNPLRGNPT